MFDRDWFGSDALGVSPDQQPSAFPGTPWRQKIDLGGVCHCKGRDLSRPVRLDTDASVVPESLLISMVVEGCHENRGLLPLSTSVRLSY